MSAPHAAAPTRGAITAELIRAAIATDGALVLTPDGYITYRPGGRPLLAKDRLVATSDALLRFYLSPAVGSIDAAATALTAALRGGLPPRGLL